MQNTVFIITVVVLIILFIAYLIIGNIVNKTPMQLVYDSVSDLSVQQRIVDSDTAKAQLLEKAGSTLFAYVYLLPGDRTQKSNGASNSVLLTQAGCWSIIINNELPVLQINTASGIESVELPGIPYQKWVALTIVREGRRFTIYYNGEVVATYRLKSYIRIQLASLQAGSPALQGKIARVHIAGQSYNKADIASMYRSTSDTRGIPYLPNDSVIPKIGCPSGLFCFVTDKPPSSPYKRWASQYS